MSKQSGHFAAALSEPKFALFAAGQLVSQFGDYLAQMALIAVIGAYTTRAPLAYSQITVAIALPALLFGPIVGVVVDRRAKSRVLIAADASRAVIIGLIPLLMKVTGSVLILFPLVFISFLMGLFASAARLSLIPYLVPQNKIFAANAVMNFINKLAGMVGFVGGGLLVVGGFWRHLKLQPWEAGFYLDSLTFLISVITIAMLKTGEKVIESEKEAELVQLWRRRINNMKTDLKELWTLIFSSPKVKFVMLSLLLVSIFGGTLYPLVVVIVQKDIGSGTGGVGVLGGVLALGMMLGSLSIGFLGHRYSRRTIIVSGLLGVGTMVSLFALCRHYWQLLPVGLLIGIFLSPVMVAQDTLLHESAPDKLWGRIFSGRDFVLNGGFMFSSLLFGFIAQIILPRLGTINHERVTLFWCGVLLTAFSLVAAGIVVKQKKAESSSG
ncbi:MAG: MFS transporter [Candidatus Edwardsbacteria bacterium]|nr:MFS transporter [Candidatus Edwardsbacteria bacterium]MBU1577046.1 MFS transporter [Candidatus Edwardsbacteria bacterium]MBU2464536.1 MFS transporter [Candidatus Edwardsbacteria bacterium]MBU2593399.1 MFS transporter [Candidatus Edwardsbacteria bacterium]